MAPRSLRKGLVDRIEREVVHHRAGRTAAVRIKVNSMVDEAIIDATRRFAWEHGVAKDAFEFQMLYGIRRDLQTRLHEEGYNVRVYVPFGDSWYPYLMRRLAERPGNLAFFLRALASRS